MAYGVVYFSVITIDQMTELRWKPEGVPGASGMWRLTWAPAISSDIDMSGNGLTGAVLGGTSSTDGPPVMLGGALPL